jgi:hypothetical protein
LSKVPVQSLTQQKRYYKKRNKRECGVATLVTDKAKSGARKIIREKKKENYIMINRLRIAALNVTSPNRVSKYLRQKLIERQ